uniref:rRNA methyltransferase 2, mitochondrial n=1 Tax=Timspurckia oligopyrenoides TaxID=708627 RepID=A0A7S0ZJV9_9RHOD|mmetsp:Transcript_738/g.1340  ORF Transcript_738/g.1340 Transcript_738/m.1340 type:complete len:269 (+) Transcript_738:30-836(+)
MYRRWSSGRAVLDPWAVMAIDENMRSRAAYKLMQMNQKFKLVKPKSTVLDLGASPGGWTLAAMKSLQCSPNVNWFEHSIDKMKKDIAIHSDINQTLIDYETSEFVDRRYGLVVAIDKEPMDPIPGAKFILGDINEINTKIQIKRRLLGRKVQIVLSDMAPKTIGNKFTDHVRIMELARSARDVAEEVLQSHGAFVVKIFRGEEEPEFLKSLKTSFSVVKTHKPAASRSESSEIYIIATGFIPIHLRTKKILDKSQDESRTSRKKSKAE